MHNVLLINPPISNDEEPKLPIGLVSLISNIPTALRDQFNFNIRDLNFIVYSNLQDGIKSILKDLVEDELYKLKPDIVGITAMSSNYPTALQIAKYVKEVNSNICVILGGVQASLAAYETLAIYNFIDYIVIGEGEKTFAKLLQQIKNRNNSYNLNGLAFKANEVVIAPPCNLIKDLDTLRTPDFSLINLERYISLHTRKNFYLPIEIGRGCSYSCKFCSTSLFWQRKYRTKTVPTLIKEIKKNAGFYHINHLEFLHDNFALNECFVNDLCDEIIKSDLSINWKASFSVEKANPPILKKLAEAGCESIFYGVETLNGKYLRSSNKKHRLKNIGRFVKENRENGIEPTCSFIFNFPNETKNEIESTLRAALKAKLAGAGRIIISQLIPETKTHYYNEHEKSLVLNESLFADNLAKLNENTVPTSKDILQHPQIFSSFYNIKNNNFSSADLLSFIERFYRQVFNTIPRTISLIISVAGYGLLELAESLYRYDVSKNICNNNIDYSTLNNFVANRFSTKTFYKELLDTLDYELKIYRLSHDDKKETTVAFFNTDMAWLTRNIDSRWLPVKLRYRSKIAKHRKYFYLFKKTKNGCVDVFEQHSAKGGTHVSHQHNS